MTSADTFVPTTISRLWPEGDGRFAALPSASDPRLLVGLGDRRAAAAGVRVLTAQRSRRARLRRDAVAAALRIGGGRMLGAAHSLPGGRGSFTDQLGAAVGEAVHVSLSVGPPRANRKPVLALARADGRVLGFAKVGVSPLSTALVEAEAAALRRLHAAELDGLEVPRLVDSARWDTYPVVVQSPLPTERARALTLAQATRAASAVAMIERRSQPLTAAPSWQRDLAALDGIDGPAAADLRALAADVLARAGDVHLEVGGGHGDWTPWNAVAVDGRVLAWDWERFATDIPVGQDVLHFHLNAATAGRAEALPQAAAAVVDRAADLLTPMGIDAATAPIVAATYLLRIGTRYLLDGQRAVGGRGGDIERWLTPALRSAIATVPKVGG